jgi:hypothetical protein
VTRQDRQLVQIVDAADAARHFLACPLKPKQLFASFATSSTPSVMDVSRAAVIKSSAAAIVWIGAKIKKLTL